MSKAPKKRAAAPAPAAEGPLGEEVVHVPKGTSRLRFLLTLALTIFVLLVFTVGDQLVGTTRRARISDVVMSWEHPTEGTLRVSEQDWYDFRRNLDAFYRVQGGRMSREEGSDENVAFQMITDRLAHDAGIEVPDAELARIIKEGEPGVMQPFLNSANYKARLQAVGVSAPAFEHMLRLRLRVMRYQLFLGFSLGQPDPADIERLWKEDHQQYAFQLAGVGREDVRAAAEAELPDDAGLQAWYEGLADPEKRRLFGERYVPERFVAELVSWDATGEAPAALLERFPQPEGADPATLGRNYYDRYLSRRYLRPEDESPEPDEADPDAPDQEPGEEPAEEPTPKETLYLPYEDVSERAAVEAGVEQALRDLLADLRRRREAQEALDLAALAAELGLEHSSDGLPRSRDEWAEATDSYLANQLQFLAPDALVSLPIVGTGHLWIARMLERKPAEPPAYADVVEEAREAWIDQRTATLAREKVQALRDALTGADDPEAVAAGALTDVVEADAFAAAAEAAGLSVESMDWFDPSRPAETDEEQQSAAEAFLRDTWFPGADLYALETEGQLAEPRASPDGERVWLVRLVGKRDPPEVDLQPAEYESLRQRALIESVTAVLEKLSSPEELSRRYGLTFPGREQEPQGTDS